MDLIIVEIQRKMGAGKELTRKDNDSFSVLSFKKEICQRLLQQTASFAFQFN